jgi:hypothetical protein
MNQPTADSGTEAAAPPGSVFAPQPSTPPPAAPAPPAAAPQFIPAPRGEVFELLARHHALGGRLSILAARLGDLVSSHGAVVSHITDQAPAAAGSTPGGTAFWGQILDQHQIVHGMLEAARTEAIGLLDAHIGLLGVAESLL